MGRAGLSGLPSGNQSVRLGVSGPEFPDKPGVARLRSFAGQASCAASVPNSRHDWTADLAGCLFGKDQDTS